MKQHYQPIDCHFYDELELLAIRGQTCQIVFHDDGVEKEIEDIIIDFKIIERAEFMLLKSGKSIRLDQIIRVNDKVLSVLSTDEKIGPTFCESRKNEKAGSQ